MLRALPVVVDAGGDGVDGGDGGPCYGEEGEG